MKRLQLVQAFLLSNPIHRGLAEQLILVGTGICGRAFSWTDFSIFPVTNICGGVLILFSLAFHIWVERDHKQAHKEYRDIDHIVTSGIYGKIRHPLYLTVIPMNIGIALAFGGLVTFILAMLSIIHWTAAALAEEKALLKKFPKEYGLYLQHVRWRMIPGIF